MGLFSTIKLIKQEYNRIKKYMEMGKEELEILSDDELFDALSTKITHDERHMEVEECINTFKGAKKIFYIVNYYEMEVNNGGLCQYFVNSSRDTAPYIIQCLDSIAANEHKELLLQFITDNNINLNDLYSFIIHDVKDFEQQVKRYPFDNFDDKFYDLEPLATYLVTYARDHLNDFL